MAMAVFSPSPPLSASSSQLSVERSFFFHSSRPSISSLSLYSFSASRPINRWRPKLREILSRRPPPLRRVSEIKSGAVDGAQEIVTAADDGSGYSIVSALLLLAFIGLSILTIGDFLQKREREKFAKEEAEKKKKDGRRKKVRARAGPRGFGQKIDEENDD